MKIVQNSLESPLLIFLPAKATSSGEINYIIKQIPVNKSLGHDMITNFIIKNLPNNVIIYLSHLFNTLFRISYFLSSWKHSIIILLLKPDKPSTNPASYRPISLLPTISKIFEKILLKKLIFLLLLTSSRTPNLDLESNTQPSTNYIAQWIKYPTH